MRSSRSSRAALIAAGLASVLAIAPIAAAQARVRGPVQDPKHGVGRSTSTNWSGYDVTGSGAAHVIGTWTQPAAQCGRRENSWSSPWVGIDGDTSGTVEQIGTDSDCSGGQPFYYAWYEMYPKSLVQLSMPVVPGHSYTGEVTAQAGGQYLLTLSDNTAKTTFSTTQAGKSTLNASVEWIVEGPSNGSLTNFGSVTFTGASATINGQTGPLGSLTGFDPITMITKRGATRAAPSAVSGSDSFSVRWQQS